MKKAPSRTEKTAGTGGAALRRLLQFLAHYRLLLGLSILLAALCVILQLYVPMLFGDAIDEIIGAHQVRFAALRHTLIQILILVAVSAAASWSMNLLNNHIAYGVVRDLRARAIRHIQKLPLSYLDSHSAGDIVSRLIADTDVVSDGLLLGFTQLFSGIMTIFVTLAFMFSKNLWITLLVLVLTPVSFLVAGFIASRSFHMFQKQSETRGQLTALVEELVGGQKVVQAFGYEARASAQFAGINQTLAAHSQKAIFYSSLTNPSTRFVNNLIYAAVALAGVLLIPGGSLTVGGLTVLLSYANQYMKPFNDISAVITEVQNALACAARIFDFLEAEEESPDASGTLEDIRGDVSIENVSFRYDPAKPLIEHFNLHAAPGTRVALVGPTGCGKTTFINLLMRFYDVTGGRICIDGVPITDLSRHALRSCFGMVLQDTWIKQGTVRENIAFGRPDASDAEIIAAAKQAHSWSFIQRLPQGLDTVLQEDEISGSKQANNSVKTLELQRF